VLVAQTFEGQRPSESPLPAEAPALAQGPARENAMTVQAALYAVHLAVAVVKGMNYPGLLKQPIEDLAVVVVKPIGKFIHEEHVG
jgi:hypothetical protein